MALVTAGDVAAGPDVGLLPLFSVGPAFAAAAGPPRRAALVGCVAVGLCLAVAWYDGLLDARRGWVAFAAVVGVTAAAVLAAVLRRRTERELADITSVAEAAQRVLLRPVPRTGGPMRIAVSYTSATAAARIGGDLYEVVPASGGTRVIVGDVQGKGLEAVETAAVVLAAFREAAPEAVMLDEVGDRLERALNRRLEGEEFVTAILAEVEPDHTVMLLNYGHPAPLVLRPDAEPELAAPDRPAAPLGLADLGPERPKPHRISLRPGEQLLLYTDGVIEARDECGVFYPLVERAGLLAEPDPDRALAALRRDLVAHVGGPLKDDAAMLLLRYREAVVPAQGPEPGRRQEAES